MDGVDSDGGVPCNAICAERSRKMYLTSMAHMVEHLVKRSEPSGLAYVVMLLFPPQPSASAFRLSLPPQPSASD
jgi:hypothetical protein